MRTFATAIENESIGRLAQLVQSICLTSRGSGVRIPQRPPKQRILIVSGEDFFFLVGSRGFAPLIVTSRLDGHVILMVTSHLDGHVILIVTSQLDCHVILIVTFLLDCHVFLIVTFRLDCHVILIVTSQLDCHPERSEGSVQ